MSESCSPTTVSLLWTIKDFRKWPMSEGCFITTPFHHPIRHIDEKVQSIVGIYSIKKGLSFQIHLDKVNVALKATVNVSVLDSEFRLVNRRNKTNFLKENKPCHFKEFIQKATLFHERNKLLCNGNLVIYCQLTFENALMQTCQHKLNNASSNFILTKNMLSLLGKGYFSDLEVQVEGKTFLSHKCVLACRSEYFSAMFRNNMKENNENKLVLADMKSSTFEKILCFIYTGHVDISESEAFPLLVAAEQFQLQTLKSVCIAKLYSSICLENASEMFRLASAYDFKDLKMKAFLIALDFTKNDFLKNELLNDEKESAADSDITQHPAEVVDRSAAGREKDAPLFPRKFKFPRTDSTFYARQRETENKRLPNADILCRTELLVSKTNRWTIQNFKEFKSSESGPLISHTVSDNGFSWKIEIGIAPALQKGRYLRCLHVNLTLVSVNVLNALASGSTRSQYEFSILNIDEKETNILRGVCVHKLNEQQKINFISVDDILGKEELLHGDDLIVCCTLLFVKSLLHQRDMLSLVPKWDLAESFSSLLKNEILSDVNIKIQNDSFLCHKAILSCYSPFFVTRLHRNDIPSEVIEIDDVDQKLFQKVLSVMYGGKCELTASEVIDLLSLEHKYCLFETTSTFDEAFLSALSTDTAAKFLKLVDSQKAKKLRKYTLDFIAKNISEVMETGEWSAVAWNQDLFSACLFARKLETVTSKSSE